MRQIFSAENISTIFVPLAQEINITFVCVIKVRKTLVNFYEKLERKE